MTDTQHSTPATSDAPAGGPRRNFVLELASIIIGGVVALAGFVSGLIVFFDPLGKKKNPPGKYADAASGGKEGFLRVATLEAVPEGSPPKRFPVLANVRDAWNFIPNQPIGAVYVQRTGEKSVLVLHTTCPHAGCAVSFAADANQYHCPCHNSSFDLEGERIDRPGKDNPSPRPMDELAVDQEKLENDGEIWVEFKDFYTGIHEQKVKI